MAKKKLNRIIRRATTEEKRRHKKIRQKTGEEFAPRRKPVSASPRRTGMTRSNLCRLEQNGENVKLETLRRYAAALDCELVIEVRQSSSNK